MEIMEILDSYVRGESVKKISEGLLKLFADDPKSLVHGTLVCFKNLGCDFRMEFEAPLNYVDAKEKLLESDDLSCKYVMSLFCLKFQHHLATNFVDETLLKLV